MRSLPSSILLIVAWHTRSGISPGSSSVAKVGLMRVITRPIKLFFLESYQDVDPEYTPVSGEITFRLMTQTSETLTEAELTAYANKIKAVFGTPPLKWKKGKDMAAYTDKEKGYQLQLLVRSKADAKVLIENILDIQSHTPDWKFLNYKENDEPTEAFPTIPDKTTILGKQRKLPRNRPIAEVVFQYATCHVHGLPNSICLYDCVGSHMVRLVE